MPVGNYPGLPSVLNMDIGIIKKRGRIDLNHVFNEIKNWLEDNDFEFHEKAIKQKERPEGTKLESLWWACKDMTEYVRYHVDLLFIITNITPVEVVKEGKKSVVQDCRFQVELKGRIELDWQKRFKGSRFLQKLQDFYHNYIIKKDILFHWGDQLEYRLLKLHRLIKDVLDFETRTNAYEGKW